MQKQVTIIGSGIVGAVTAYYLSQNPDLNVTIYDEGIGQATKNSAGIISPWLSKRRNQRWYQLAKAGLLCIRKLLRTRKWAILFINKQERL